ncbi:rCG58490 [Rattus norvegicus]|uniref:RCG58490 n=1 Tax=Rattus norvegicus TaxID=10116 RepID=A6K6T4_RAT|nr:rCG58490 [Rattus norvegicus]
MLAEERCAFKPVSLMPAKVNLTTICSGKLHPANPRV